MSRVSHIAAVLALVVAPSSCVRLEMESPEEIDPQALRISGEDAVVLCPLAAAAEPSGDVSIVWAGYPPADDRLQLIHARLSETGKLVQPPVGIAFLQEELVALGVQDHGSSLEIQAVERESSEMLAIQIDAEGVVLGTRLEAVESSWVVSDTAQESCEAIVGSGDSRTRVFRAQVDGELPLFAEPAQP